MTRHEFLENVPFEDGDKCFIVVQRKSEDGSDNILSQRLCVGFSAFELLGVLTNLQLSVHSQINGMEEPVTCISKEWRE